MQLASLSLMEFYQQHCKCASISVLNSLVTLTEASKTQDIGTRRELERLIEQVCVRCRFSLSQWQFSGLPTDARPFTAIDSARNANIGHSEGNQEDPALFLSRLCDIMAKATTSCTNLLEPLRLNLQIDKRCSSEECNHSTSETTIAWALNDAEMGLIRVEAAGNNTNLLHDKFVSDTRCENPRCTSTTLQVTINILNSPSVILVIPPAKQRAADVPTAVDGYDLSAVFVHTRAHYTAALLQQHNSVVHVDDHHEPAHFASLFHLEQNLREQNTIDKDAPPGQNQSDCCRDDNVFAVKVYSRRTEPQGNSPSAPTSAPEHMEEDGIPLMLPLHYDCLIPNIPEAAHKEWVQAALITLRDLESALEADERAGQHCGSTQHSADAFHTLLLHWHHLLSAKGSTLGDNPGITNLKPKLIKEKLANYIGRYHSGLADHGNAIGRTRAAELATRFQQEAEKARAARQMKKARQAQELPIHNTRAATRQQPQAQAEEHLRRKFQLAEHKVRRNQLSAAARILTSNRIVISPKHPTVMTKLQQLHPAGTPTPPLPPDAETITVTVEMLRSLKPHEIDGDKAGGPDGIRGAHILPLLADDDGARMLAKMLTMLASGHAHPEIRKAVTASRMSIQAKQTSTWDNPDPRPVTIASTLIRLLDIIAIKQTG